jgi:Raf kinase inhibitor-like protein, YbhB/YbcL family
MSPIVSDKTVSVRAPQAPKSGAALKVSSKSFSDGADIPMENVFTGCGGKNVSPQLSWSGAPSGTKSFAIGCFDPDAPTGSGYWHWVLFNLPGETTSLEAGEGNEETPRGGTTGYSDFGMNEYGGPCPPKGDGQHRYIFTVYALDTDEIPGGSSATGATMVFLMRGHVLASGSITGLFGH